MTLQSFLWLLFRPLLILCALAGFIVWGTQAPPGAITATPEPEVPRDPPASAADELPWTAMAPPPIDFDVYLKLRHLCSYQDRGQGRQFLAEFFTERAWSLRSQTPPLYEAVYNLNRQDLERYLDDSTTVDAAFVRSGMDWRKLRIWWENGGMYMPISRLEFNRPQGNNSAAFYAARARVASLAYKRHYRTESENEELEQLMVRAGRDWLGVPYDENTGRFEPDGEWSPYSAEVAFALYKQMYLITSGKKW